MTFSRKNTTYREKGQVNKKVCSVLQTQQKEGNCFGALIVRLDFVLRAVSGRFTPS
jgi:hypothetical protein